MSNPYFKFKQFTIYHDRCAMKVGTDGVLLGAWASVNGVRNVLDIGTGTGLIALMIAQRCQLAQVRGIDVDKAAVEQARDNMRLSPWAERLEVYEQDIRELDMMKKYDLIVSNPPFFTEKVYCPDNLRNTARHTSCLTFRELIQSVSRLLEADGCFSVILPANMADSFIGLATQSGLYLSRRTWVHTKANMQPKRVLMEFVRSISFAKTNYLILEQESRVYSADFTALVKDFYLAL